MQTGAPAKAATKLGHQKSHYDRRMVVAYQASAGPEGETLDQVRFLAGGPLSWGVVPSICPGWQQCSTAFSTAAPGTLRYRRYLEVGTGCQPAHGEKITGHLLPSPIAALQTALKCLQKGFQCRIFLWAAYVCGTWHLLQRQSGQRYR